MNELNSKLKNILDFVPEAAWKKLEKQTNEDIQNTAPFIKFVCMSDKRFPSFVVFEEHIGVSIDEKSKKIKEKLLNRLGLEKSDNYIKLISLHFAGRELEDEDKLSENGVAYTDKVYFYVDIENIKEFSKKKDIIECKKELYKIEEKLHTEPELYGNLSEYLLNCLQQNNIKLSTEIWKNLLILRNFAGFMGKNVEKEKQKKIAQCSSNHLLDALHLIKKLDSNETYLLQYNIVNILEWLAYRYPNVFGENIEEPILGDYENFNCRENEIYRRDEVGKRFVCNLLDILKNNNSPLSLKLETVWAFSWAGISHPGLAIYIVNSLKQLLNEHISEYELTEIAVALLRSTVLRIIYPDAGKYEELGGFHALSAKYALIVTDAAIEDVSQLSAFNNIIKDLSSEFLYGLSILYSVAGEHYIASHYFKLSAKDVRDKFWAPYRLGLCYMELAEYYCENIDKSQECLDKAIEEFEKANNAKEYAYLFCWDSIPGNDSVRLIEFLNENFDVNWVKPSMIKKSIDTIYISDGKNSVSLILNHEKMKARLTIDGCTIYELIVNIENGKLNVYEFNIQKQLLIDFRINLCRARKIFLDGINYWMFDDIGKSVDYFENAISQYCEVVSSKSETISKSERSLIECYCIFSTILKNIVYYNSFGEFFDDHFILESYLKKLKNCSDDTLRSNLKCKFNRIKTVLAYKNLDEKLRDRGFINELIEKINSFAQIISVCPIEGLPEIEIELVDINENIKVDSKSDTVYTSSNIELMLPILVRAFEEKDEEENKVLKNYDGIRIEERKLRYFSDPISKEDIKKQKPILLDFSKVLKKIVDMDILLIARYTSRKPHCNISRGKKTVHIRVKREFDKEISSNRDDNLKKLKHLSGDN